MEIIWRGVILIEVVRRKILPAGETKGFADRLEKPL